jgi:hypothetical protein
MAQNTARTPVLAAVKRALRLVIANLLRLARKARVKVVVAIAEIVIAAIIGASHMYHQKTL